MTFEAIATVQNTPDYARKCRYWIVTPHNGELWFYSAWNDYDKAVEAAMKDQIILENGDVKE